MLPVTAVTVRSNCCPELGVHWVLGVPSGRSGILSIPIAVIQFASCGRCTMTVSPALRLAATPVTSRLVAPTGTRSFFTANVSPTRTGAPSVPPTEIR